MYQRSLGMFPQTFFAWYRKLDLYNQWSKWKRLWGPKWLGLPNPGRGWILWTGKPSGPSQEAVAHRLGSSTWERAKNFLHCLVLLIKRVLSIMVDNYFTNSNNVHNSMSWGNNEGRHFCKGLTQSRKTQEYRWIIGQHTLHAATINSLSLIQTFDKNWEADSSKLLFRRTRVHIL